MHRKLLIFAVFINSILTLHAQNRMLIDAVSAGGNLANCFDLGKRGFVLSFNKLGSTDGAYGKDGSVTTNLQYFSKDLTKRANFKLQVNGQLTMLSTEKHLYAIDRVSSLYKVTAFDFSGHEIASRKFDISTSGLSNTLIAKTHVTLAGNLLFEVYDGQDELHLYQLSVLDPKATNLMEVDLPLPSSEPLGKLEHKGRWKLVAENMGYFILARKGADAEYDPTQLSFHLAFYDEQFTLFKEFLLEGILPAGTNLVGRDAAFALNASQQSFVVSCLTKSANGFGVLTANYGMDPSSNILKVFWKQQNALIDNDRNQFVLNDGLSVPPVPVISERGSQVLVRVMKTKISTLDEPLNQLLLYASNGSLLFNEVQLGAFDQLNLDGFCVDNNNMYSRIRKMQMGAFLKPHCENAKASVLDLDVDEKGNELVILSDKSGSKEQITIARFPAK